MKNASNPADKGMKKKIKTIVLVVGLFVLAGLAGSLAYKLQHPEAKEEATLKPLPLPKIVNDVQNLNLAGKTDDALKYIDDGLNKSDVSDADKYQLYIQQGNIYAEQSKFDEAVKAFEQARAVKETYEVVRKLGISYQQTGDNTKAIENYKKAIQLNPKDNPLRESQNNQLKEMITNLGGTP